MMPDRVLGTSTSDPDFYQRKVAQLGQTLGVLFGNSQKRRQEQEARDAEELERFLKTAAIMPDVAAGPWGADITKRLEKRYPGVGAIVDAYKNRTSAKKEIEDSGAAYLDYLDEVERGYQGKVSQFQGLPDSVNLPVPTTMFGSVDIPIPNPQKEAMKLELGSIDPMDLPMFAHQRLTARQRMAARSDPRLKDMLPQIPDLDDLPPEVRAVKLSQMGYVSGETAEAARVKAGLRRSPAEVEKTGADIAEQKRREGVSEAERIARETAAAAQARLTDSLARGRIGLNAASQRGVIDYKAGVEERTDERVSWKTLTEETGAEVKDYDARQQEAVSLAGTNPKAKAKAKTDFIAENGPRPALIPETQARLIAKKINSVPASGEDRLRALAAAMARYRKAVAAGKSPGQATREILGQ